MSTASARYRGAEERPLVAHVVYSFGVGGLENGVVNLVNNLPDAAFRHAIVSLTTIAPAFAARIRRDDVEMIALDKPPGHLWRLYPRLARTFRALRPAIIHTRNLAALEAVVPAWWASGARRVHGEHGRDVGDLDGSNRKYRLVRRLYAPLVDRWVAMSKDLERYLVADVGIRASRVTQLYNGVDTDRFRAPRGGRDAIPGCRFAGDDLWIVGTVGRLQTVKDQPNLARAFVHAVRACEEARRRMRLVIAGDGALASEVRTILAEGGVSDLAWLAGERADVPEIMRGLDCFVLPSLAEGISNTILEAMATGLPVVATAVGGNVELIEPGTTGLLVPAADSTALGNAILDYFRNEPMRARHGANAREAARRRFSLQRMVDDYAALYAGLIGRPLAGTIEATAQAVREGGV